MGTISTRKRKDGTQGYTAQIRRKEDGRVVYTESRTFDREQAAKIWLRKRESELDKVEALEQLAKDDPPLSKVIQRYRQQSNTAEGDTKRNVLNIIAESGFAQLKCSKIRSQEIVRYAQELLAKPMQPQTVANYLSHLSPVFALAKPAWGYPLDGTALDDARRVLKQLRVISKSAKRDRRPALDELHRLLSYFQAGEDARPNKLPMVEIILFAIFSCRRLDEITRLRTADLDDVGARIWVREMKHPTEKMSNDVLVTLTKEALHIIKHRLNRTPDLELIFPHNSGSISARFTWACQILDIQDLHFHDLRHEGISRLFELGWTIPQAATVSGHRSWTVMQRYTHIQQRGDKYEGWWMRWLK